MSGTDFVAPNEPGSPGPASGSNAMHHTEVRRIRGILREITGFAEHASMTGALRGGGKQAVRQYNAIVAHLRGTNAFPPYLLVELEEDASLDDAGVAARMLSGYLKADEEPPRPPHPPHPPDAPFAIANLREVQELKEIGQRIREQLPDWLKGRIAEGERQGRPARETAVAELETRLDQIGNELEEITRQLREGDLNEERRAEMANRLSELSREQARLEVQRENLNEGA